MRYEIEKDDQKVVIDNPFGFWPRGGVGFNDSDILPTVYEECRDGVCDKVRIKGLLENEQYFLITSSQEIFPRSFYIRGTKLSSENTLKIENGIALRLEVGQRIDLVWKVDEFDDTTHEATVRALR
jgi:hypothetical protein